MSKKMPNILYFGNPATGRWLQTAVEPAGGYVYTPTELLETLGIAILFWPDLVLLDACVLPQLAEEVAQHLRSIDITPVIVHSEGELIAAVSRFFPEWAMSNEGVGR